MIDEHLDEIEKIIKDDHHDNAPHHPEVQSFPLHKHTTVEIKESEMPNIRDILSEIYQHIIKGLLSK